jgi:hypothetical protein
MLTRHASFGYPESRRRASQATTLPTRREVERHFGPRVASVSYAGLRASGLREVERSLLGQLLYKAARREESEVVARRHPGRLVPQLVQGQVPGVNVSM